MAIIYVELLEEGTTCFRPVEALLISENIYQILDGIPEDEVWAFQPNDTVKCELKELSEGVVLVAKSKISDTQ